MNFQAKNLFYFTLKNFQDRKWYNFDDSTVTPLKIGEIESTFGGGVSFFDLFFSFHFVF